MTAYEDDIRSRRRRKREEELTLQGERGEAALREHKEADEQAFVGLMFGELTRSFEERLQRLSERLKELDRASRESLIAAERRASEALERLEEMEKRASVTADGRRIYRSRDGTRAFFEDETEATREELEGVDWKTGAPTWQERQEEIRRREEAERQREEIIRYREEVLKPAQERVGDGQPLSPDELAGLEAGIENMPGTVRGELADQSKARQSVAREHAPDGSFGSAPDTTAAFARANTTPAPSGVPGARPVPAIAPTPPAVSGP